MTMMSQIKLMDMILKISEKLMMIVTTTIMMRLLFKVNIAMTATYMIFGLSLFMMVFHLVQVKMSSSSKNHHQLHCIKRFNVTYIFSTIKDNNTCQSTPMSLKRDFPRIDLGGSQKQNKTLYTGSTLIAYLLFVTCATFRRTIYMYKIA